MRYILLSLLFLFTNKIYSQTTQDTIDFPYWQQMMLNKNINFYTTKRAYDLYYSNKPKLPQTGYKVFERWAERWKSDINPDGTFPAADYVLNEVKKFKKNSLTLRSANGNWVNIGPFNSPPPAYIHRGVGRISAIGFHPTNQDIIYCGAPQGGFWKSIDKGLNWTSTSDNLPSLGVSAILSLTNTKILIGTGDRDASDANGMGVYVSTDGGTTFVTSSIGMGNKTVNKLLVNPLNPNTIVAATDGGIYFSYNQGANWVLKSANLDYKDIQYCPLDSTTLYAAAGGTLYKTTNSGANWNSAISGFTGTGRNRLAIGVTEHNPNIVYVVASNSSNNKLESFYKSSNKATSFTVQTTSATNILGGTIDMADNRGQGWYDLAIETSPTDSNFVIVGGINIFKTINGGTSWTPSASWYAESGTPFVHADIHVFGRNPIAPTNLFVGSDGGVDMTLNNGNTWSALNNGLSISQFYDMDVSKLSKTRTISGAQDNGTATASSSTTWLAEFGGDGMNCQISELDTTKMVGESQYGNMQSSNNNGASWNDATGGITETPGPWNTKFELHPRVNNILVSVYKNVWVSVNPFAASPSNSKFTAGISAEGTAVRFSNKDDDYVFVGWVNGTIKYSNNITSGSPSFNSLTTPPGGSSAINDIETSYKDTNILYVAQGTEIYKSINRGVSWTNISGNLPNISMKSIVIDKNTVEGLYVGTAAGVYYKDSSMANWIFYNTGLPLNSAITDLEIVYDTFCTSKSRIYAATYGRGLWYGDLYISEIEPTPTFTIAASACAGVTVPINDATPNNSNTSYKWTITPSTGVTYQNGTSDISGSPDLQFTNPGNYTIKLRTQKYGAGNCTVVKNNIINIGTSGNVVVNINSDTFICPGDTINLVATGAVNYKWSPNVNLSDTAGTTVKVFPFVNTDYRVISNINGNCFDTAVVSVKMKSFPSISYSGNTTVCNSAKTTINLNGADSFSWSPTTFLTSKNSINSNVDITPANSTNYTITGYKVNQCNAKINIPIQNQIPANYTFNTAKNRTICAGDTSTYILMGSNLPSSVWSPNTGLIRKSKDTFIVKPSATTKYYLTTLDTNICPFKDSFVVTVMPIPVVTIAGDTGMCIGQEYPLVASGATTYSWSPSTYLNTTTGASVLTRPNNSISYTVTGSNGTCSSTNSIKITTGAGVPNFQVTGKKIVCSGASTILTASDANSYLWSPANIVSNPYAKSVQISPSGPVTLKVIGSSFGCKDSVIINLSVENNPLVSVSTSNPTSICEGEKVTISAAGSKVYSISPTYNYTKIDSSTFQVFPASSTTYTILGSSINGCSGKDSLPITVHPKPKLLVTPKITTLYRGQQVTINATGADSFSWTPDKYILNNSNTSSSLVSKPDSDIVYYLKAKSQFGCISYDLAIVYVLNDTSTQPTTAIHNTLLNSVKIYPNPANSYLVIESEQDLNVDLKNVMGVSILNKNIEIGKNKIDLSDLISGTYILYMKNNEGVLTIEKLIINK